jgi:hypothetical protein
MLCHKKQDIRDSSRIMELSITVKQLIIKVKQVYLRIPRIQLFEAFSANKNWRLIMQNLQPFIDTNINYIIVNDYDQLNEEDFDALLSGSDQIWRAPYVTPIEKGFLNFAKD